MDKILWQSENRLKDKVYKEFENKRKAAHTRVVSKKREVESEAYEDQDAFMPHSELGTAINDCKETESLIEHLYPKPYFSHMSMSVENGETEEYFLSSNEHLDTVIFIGNDGYLLPFKQDKKRLFFSEIFHAYQAKDGEEIVRGDGEKTKPTLICDDEICDGELLSAILVYSDKKEKGSIIDADELLAEKLQEHRNNPTLSNIIATLQRSQFEIIQADENVSFVVQGCAGSGKSQILLHRLFFLRDTLSEKNWSNVMLITPSELFRDYSAELVRRYGLSTIKNNSIAELYRELLNGYDSNFKNRQYEFELTEEYLPDEYLNEVYSYDTIKRIDGEIEKALRVYFSEAWELVGKTDTEQIDADEAKRLIEEIYNVISNIDKQVGEQPKEEEETVIQDELKKLKERLAECIERLSTAEKELELLKDKEKTFNTHKSNYDEAKNEQLEWNLQRSKRKQLIEQELAALEEEKFASMTADVPARYAHQLYLLYDITEGKTYKTDEEYLAFLNSYCDEMLSELTKYTENVNQEAFAADIKKSIRNQQTVISKLQDEEAVIRDSIESKALELIDLQVLLQSSSNLEETRSKLVRSRYFLQRIETAVFERQVWNALAEIKAKYQIKTLSTKKVGAVERKSRILYKSDLLFYLKIYKRLHPKKEIRYYNLLCIDEGQDLHKADYDFLKSIYPSAVFNIFGDKAQVLHERCGISNWKDELQIQQVYQLNKNYRNEAAIVDFCNKRFGTDMKGLGPMLESKYPEVVEEQKDLNKISQMQDITVVVKNREMFHEYCEVAGCEMTDYEFLDTNASGLNTTKPKCYTVFAAKGLEFSKVLVYSNEMTKNQRVVACTRAMERLYYYE